MQLRAALTIGISACLAAALACTSCGGRNNGTPSDPEPEPGSNAQIQVLRNASGAPTGIRVRWGIVSSVSKYHLYKSNATIPDTARGDVNFMVSINGSTTISSAGQPFVQVDDLFPLTIGDTWFYRVSAVNNAGEESVLSEEASVTVSAFIVDELLNLSVRPGESFTVVGRNLGLYDAATDKVRVPAVEWVNGVGFQPLMADCFIQSWNPTGIQAIMPNGATKGQVEVSIGSDTQLTPEEIENANPYISSLLPISGDVTTPIELLGGNFGPAMSPDSRVLVDSADVSAPANYQLYTDSRIVFFHPPAAFRLHEVQVKVFDTSLGADVTSNSGFFDLVNAPPVVFLRANPDAGGAPLDVQFTPARFLGGPPEYSYDPDGKPIAEYRYDFESDGTDDLIKADSSDVFYQYKNRGTFQCTLTCLDADGAQSSTSVTITPGNNPPTAAIRAIPTSGSVPFQSSFDASLSSDVDGTITKYEWDFDGDGTYDLDSGASNKASFYYNFQGSYDATVRVTDNDGATDTAIATVTAGPPSGRQTIVIREDGGGYSTNFNALISDLNDIGAQFDNIGYHNTVADSVLGGGYKLAIWYHGGPGTSSGTEVEPDARQWTSAQIDNYLQIMQDGNGVLLFSQNHGKVSELDAAIPNGWADPAGYGFTLCPNGIPDAEKRHPWAAGLATNLGVQPGGAIAALPTSPASVTGASTGAAAGSDSGNAAERFNGPGSSGQVPTNLRIPVSRQLCALGFNSTLLPAGAYSSGFTPGLYLQPQFMGADCALVSWGNTDAPDANIGDGNPYNHEVGAGKLYIVGYSWSEMAVASPAGMPRSAVLENIMGWMSAP